MFVKYDCGCKGFIHARDNAEVEHYIIKPCDYDGRGHQFGMEKRDMEGKKWDRCTDIDTLPLINTLSHLISYGQDMEEIKRIIRKV
jgi:hypothetical protein